MRCFVPPRVEPSQGKQACTLKVRLIKMNCLPALHWRTTTHYDKDAGMPEWVLLPPLCILSHPPLLFSPEPADRFDVLPAGRPHRLLGGLSEESQGARRTRQGAVGYLRGPREEVPSPAKRWPIAQVPLQKWWAVPDVELQQANL